LTGASAEIVSHPSHPSEEHQYVGRRRILFCDERDIHHRQLEARRLPPYPPGHPARNGRDAEIRAVRLPGHPEPGTLPQPDDAEEADSAAAAG
jgi:hypothetical protein